MPSNRTNELMEFWAAIEVFISGRRRGTIFVREIEGMFAELFDDDERFEELQYALAMFGVSSGDSLFISDELNKLSPELP